MKTKTIIKGQNGGAIVEFAIILPILISLLFGIVEFGLLLYDQQIITNASREGARAGVVIGLDRSTSEEQDISKSVAATYCSDYLITFSDNANPLTITATSTGTHFEDELTVTVTYLYDFLVLKSFGLGPISLTERTTMRLE